MSASNIDNIKAIYQLATLTEKQDGINWYPVALDIARTIAEEQGVTVPQAIGVIAALSPRNRWERNVQDAVSLIAAFNAGGAEQAMLTKVCTFTSNKAKAVKILSLTASYQEEVTPAIARLAATSTSASAMKPVLDILSGPKLREFASCIAGLPDVCIDGHAFCIWAANRTGLKDVPAIGVKLRREIKADYVAAADELGITASACQAITWVTWRRIHGVTK